MLDNADQNDWNINESVGQWLTRRLKEVYDKIPLEKKRTHSIIIPPPEWLSNETNINIDTIYELKRSKEFSLQEQTRERLAYKKISREGEKGKVLGYYGYPPIDRSENCNLESLEKRTEQIKNDFKSTIDLLSRSELECQFCKNETKSFLYNSACKKSSDDNESFTLFASSHQDKDYGAINAHGGRGFEVEFTACKRCLTRKDIITMFTTPLSILIERIEQKNELSINKIAKIFKVSPSTISRVKKGEFTTLREELIRKIYTLWFYGSSHRKSTDSEKIYEKSILEFVDIELGRGDIDEYIGIFETILQMSLGDLDLFSKFPEELKGGEAKIEQFELTKYTFDQNSITMFFTLDLSMEKNDGYPYFETNGCNGSRDLKFVLCDKEQNLVYEIYCL